MRRLRPTQVPSPSIYASYMHLKWVKFKQFTPSDGQNMGKLDRSHERHLMPAVDAYGNQFSLALTNQPVFSSAKHCFHSVLATLTSWALPQQGRHTEMLEPPVG